MFLNIVAGIEILNFFEIIHSDLNFRNIFVIANKRFQVKIGDLGFAIKIIDDKKSKYSAMNLQGDKKFISPEINEGYYTPTTDIYTLGIIFQELFSSHNNLNQ